MPLATSVAGSQHVTSSLDPAGFRGVTEAWAGQPIGHDPA
jgi:hypothetical protein